MKSFHALVFEDVVAGTTAVHSETQLNELLAMAEGYEVVAIASQVTGASARLTIELEASSDNRNWVTDAAVISSAALSTTDQTMVGGKSSMDIRSGFARLRISLSGTDPAARLEVYVTGRGESVVI